MTTEQETEQEDTQGRLITAMESIGYIQKDGKNTFGQGYKYLSEKAVKEAVQAALVKSKVMPLSIRFEVLEDDVREVPIGKRIQNIIKLRAVITFPGGYVFEGLGSSADVSDKAMMQAQTTALREAWKNVFVIPSGDDAEVKTPGDGDQEPPPEEPRLRPSARAKKEPQDILGGPADEQPGLRTDGQRQEILSLLGNNPAPMTRHAAGAYAKDRWGCSPSEINTAQAVLFIAHLKGLVKS